MAPRSEDFTAYELNRALAELYNSLLGGAVAKEDMARFSDVVLHVIAAVHVVLPEVSVLGPAAVVPIGLPADERQGDLSL